MKTTRIIIGIAAALILPLAGATAWAVSNPSKTQAGAGVDRQQSASHAYNYGRDSRGKSSKDSKSGKGRHGSKGSRGGKGSHGSRGGHGSKSKCKKKRGR
jgi:hypothetical protein